MSFFRPRSFCLRSSLIAVPVLVSCSAATADLVNRWEVGSGDATAMIQFDFLSSGNTYVVDLFFDGSMSGQAAIEMIAADSTTAGFSFEYDVISYSFGDFLVGIDIEGDSDYGDGSMPPWLQDWKTLIGKQKGKEQAEAEAAAKEKADAKLAKRAADAAAAAEAAADAAEAATLNPGSASDAPPPPATATRVSTTAPGVVEPEYQIGMRYWVPQRNLPAAIGELKDKRTGS